MRHHFGGLDFRNGLTANADDFAQQRLRQSSLSAQGLEASGNNEFMIRPEFHFSRLCLAIVTQNRIRAAGRGPAKLFSAPWLLTRGRTALQSPQQLRERCFQRPRQRIERVDPRRDRSIFNLRKMRSPNPGHICQLDLRQAALFPHLADSPAKPDRERDCHFPIVAAIVGLTVRFTEQSIKEGAIR